MELRIIEIYTNPPIENSISTYGIKTVVEFAVVNNGCIVSETLPKIKYMATKYILKNLKGDNTKYHIDYITEQESMYASTSSPMVSVAKNIFITFIDYTTNTEKKLLKLKLSQ